MNRPLRKAHVWLIALLTPVTISIFAASIAARRTIPPIPVPASLQDSTRQMQETGRRLVHADGFDVEVRGLMDSTGARFIEFNPLNQPHIADLLAYIRPAKNAAFDGEVRLLGSVYASCPVRFPLPVDSTQTLSEIYLYSGATHTVVGRVNLTDSSGTTP